jgi:hypothetical protein
MRGEIGRLRLECDRARQQLVYLRSVSHACDIKHIDAALADEPPVTVLIERICDEYDEAFRALADKPPKEEP